MPHLLPLLTLAAATLVMAACQSPCGAQQTPEATKACNDQQFQDFQQQIRDSRPAGR